MPTYPFVPKSTRLLSPGDYWAVPLEDGRFACGRVLQTKGDHLPTPSRTFFGGLHDWVAERPPVADDIGSAGLIDCGIMHLKAITESGGKVLGHCPMGGIELPLALDGRAGRGVRVVRGAQTLRPASEGDFDALPVLGTWGSRVITVLARSKLRA